ncbi:MAG TPA: hypothetical protein VEQ37_07485 [Actinomycetota bacterium]|nr:hypothetical protein [Actinomycetota bacterium]
MAAIGYVRADENRLTVRHHVQNRVGKVAVLVQHKRSRNVDGCEEVDDRKGSLLVPAPPMSL